MYIFQHLGLGDHVINNGLIRTIIDPEKEYRMFVFERNMESVRFMYRDIQNLDFIPVNSWKDPDKYFAIKGIVEHDIIRIKYNIGCGLEFDHYFYESMAVPFTYRWSQFYCERDLDREKALFKSFGIKEKEYVFIHDDSQRGFNIDESHIINKDLPIIRPDPSLTGNIFDYCYLMNFSAESHFIDSCFRLVYDSFALRGSNIFYHLKLKDDIIKDTYTKSDSQLPFVVFK